MSSLKLGYFPHLSSKAISAGRKLWSCKAFDGWDLCYYAGWCIWWHLKGLEMSLIWWTEFQVGLSAWYSCCCRQDRSNNLSLDNWGWEPWRNFGFLNVLYETSVFAGWSSKFRQLQTFMLICKPRIQCSPKVWSLLCTFKMWVIVYLDLFLT